MSLTQVTGPYPIFTDLDGSPLDDGYLYIGDQNDDPETNPIQVFWDSALTIPATQPIRTNSGYAWRNGTPGLLYTAGPFSITIRNKRNEFVLYSPLGYGFDPAAVSASVVKNDFIGDGVEVDFTLSSAPSTILATNVFINGVYQEKDSYTLSGNVITFSVAPPLGSSIEIMTNETGIINSGNATAISYTLTAAGAVAQTVQTKLEQSVSVKDFGAVGDGVANDTAAIQAAIDSNIRDICFPEGNYLCGNLSFNNDYQRFYGPGAIITRSGNGVTFTVSARAVYFYAIRFEGGGFTGDNLTVTGPEAMFIGCISKGTSGRAIKFANDGGNALLLGGIYTTSDGTASGYDVEFFDTTPGTSLYSKVIGISTNQATGGILINGQAAVRVTDGQIGKLTVSAGSGFFVNNRVIGATSIQSSINLFTNNSFAANITFGTAAASNISQITFGPTNVAQSGITLTINNNVLDSSFHLGQLTGVTLVINGNNNDIWHNELAYTPTLVGTGSPSLGNGTLNGRVSRNGREWVARVELTIGSTTSLGSAFDVTAPHKAKYRTQGSALLTDSGTGQYMGVADIASGSSTVKVYAGNAPIGGSLTPTAPFTWATNDTLALTITGQYTA